MLVALWLHVGHCPRQLWPCTNIDTYRFDYTGTYKHVDSNCDAYIYKHRHTNHHAYSSAKAWIVAHVQ